MERLLVMKLETRQISFKYGPKVSDLPKLMFTCLYQSITPYCLYLHYYFSNPLIYSYYFPGHILGYFSVVLHCVATSA